jgi:Rab3 GTPase-activating protein catalytic subunit
LVNSPDRGVNHPLLQQPPCHTEDQLQEQQAAVVALAESAAAAGATAAAAGGGQVSPALLLQHKLTSAGLLSDMSAFKAANPGALLEDFLAWDAANAAAVAAGTARNSSSKEQVCKDTTSAPTADTTTTSSSSSSSIGSSHRQQRAGVPGGLWQQLWDMAPPIPAAAQKPLLDPVREGERVVHYLETLSPVALLSQLVCVAVSEFSQLLAAAAAAQQLPAVAVVVARFENMAASILRRCNSNTAAAAAAAPIHGSSSSSALAWDGGGAATAVGAGLGGSGGSSSSGWNDVELELLLSELMYLEQVGGEPSTRARWTVLQHAEHVPTVCALPTPSILRSTAPA